MVGRIRFDIEWEDILPDPETGVPLHSGWYVDGQVLGGPGVRLGPSPHGPGSPTVDAALEHIEKWAGENGYRYARPMIQVFLIKAKEEG